MLIELYNETNKRQKGGHIRLSRINNSSKYITRKINDQKDKLVIDRIREIKIRLEDDNPS